MWSTSKTLLMICLASCITLNAQAETDRSTASSASTDSTDNRATQAAVEFKQSLPTTMEEIATVDVLGEICPKILGERIGLNFNQGYQNLLQQLLPKIPNPSLAIQTLRDDTEYNGLLMAARADTAQYTIAENRAVCLDVLHYPAPPPSQPIE